MDEHAREPVRPIDPAGVAARKVYSTPHLTRWGSVPRVTQVDADTFSGIL